jgi:hypothetical protein
VRSRVVRVMLLQSSQRRLPSGTGPVREGCIWRALPPERVRVARMQVGMRVVVSGGGVVVVVAVVASCGNVFAVAHWGARRRATSLSHA